MTSLRFTVLGDPEPQGSSKILPIRRKFPLTLRSVRDLMMAVVITSDNPRSENPERIIEEIRLGITPDTRRDSAQGLLSIVDRRAAIAKAIELARPGELVLVAGKGHEQSQVIGDEHLPFDDAAVAREALARRRTNSGVV